jgi:hypothetical protein
MANNEARLARRRHAVTVHSDFSIGAANAKQPPTHEDGPVLLRRLWDFLYSGRTGLSGNDRDRSHP